MWWLYQQIWRLGLRRRPDSIPDCMSNREELPDRRHIPFDPANWIYSFHHSNRRPQSNCAPAFQTCLQIFITKINSNTNFTFPVWSRAPSLPSFFLPSPSLPFSFLLPPSVPLLPPYPPPSAGAQNMKVFRDLFFYFKARNQSMFT